jgi:hypothetical protein
MSTRCMRDVFSRIASSSGASGDAPCPVPCGAIRSPCEPANRTASTTSAADSAETAAAGREDGITANAVHPGAVIETGLARELDTDLLAAAIKTPGYDYKTREQGAATSALVAASPLLEGISGRYFADCNEAPIVDSSFTGPPRGFGVAPYALDPENARRLWDASLSLIGNKR